MPSDNTAPAIYVARYPSVTATHPEAESHVSLERLAAFLTKFVETEEKHGVPLLSFARTADGSTRANKNVTDVSCLVFDVDNKHEGVPMEIGEAQWRLRRKLHCTYILHTTHSHGADRPRFRILIPLARPVSRDDYPHLWKSVRQRFPVGIDDGTKDPARLWYCPSHRPGEQEHAFAEVAPELPWLDPAREIEWLNGTSDFEEAKQRRAEEEFNLMCYGTKSGPPASAPALASQISPNIRTLIEEGATKGQRSEALAKVYVALRGAGLDAAQILAVVTDPANGISEKPRQQGEEWARQDIARMIGKLSDRGSILDEIAGLVEAGDRKAAADLCLSWEAAHAFAQWHTTDKPAATRWRLNVVKQGLKNLVSLGDFDPLWRDCTAQVAATPDEAQEPDAWQEPVQGAKLLTSISKGIRRFVVLSEAAADACALFVMHSWCFDAAERTPFLFINAPTKRSGKTVLLEVLEQLVRRPYWGANTSPAGLFRLIEKNRHTVLLDEVHHLFHRNADPELVRMLNTSHSRRSASVDRCVEVAGEIDVRSFSIWSPKVLAGILRPEIPEEIIDRSILIALRRKTRGEHTERAREHNLETLRPLAAQAKRWALDHVEQLSGVTPRMPQELNDRACDCWEPLVAVADLIGGRWPERARAVACELAQGVSGDSADDGVALVQDIRKAFDLVAERVLLGDDDGALFFGDPAGINTEEQITSHALQRLLCNDDAFFDRPWQEWSHGREITPRDIARLLAPFGVTPTRVSQPMKAVQGRRRVVRGYVRAHFVDLWTRYAVGAENDA